MKISLPNCLLFLVILFLMAPCAAAEDDNRDQQEYRFGIFPHLPPTKLQKTYAPVANDFAKQLKKKVRYSTRPTYKKFTEELANEAYDIAFVQPFDYVWAHDKHNYEPLATRAEPLTTVFIVKKQSSIDSVSDLKNKVIVNPPESAAVSRMTTRALKKMGLDHQVKRTFVRSHFSCMQRVLINLADACGTAPRALKYFEEKKMANRFRVIHETDPIPHALYIVHKRVPESHKQILKRTILGWSKSKKGRAMMQKNKFANFVEIDDRQYDIVREMNKHPN